MSFSFIKVVPPPLLVCVELNPGPPKMTDEKRSEVIGYLKAGKNAAEAAQEFHVDKSSVKRLKRKFRETGKVATRKGQGRKRKLSTKQKKSIIKKAKRGKKVPQITREVSRSIKEPVSTETIRRTIKESKLQYLVVEEEDELTQKQKRTD